MKGLKWKMKVLQITAISGTENAKWVNFHEGKPGSDLCKSEEWRWTAWNQKTGIKKLDVVRAAK